MKWSKKNLFGRWKDDVLVAEDGNVRIFGGWGDDTLIASSTTRSLYGGWGDDVMYGSTNTKLFSGGWGNDTAYSTGGDSKFLGGRGHDTFVTPGSFLDYTISKTAQPTYPLHKFWHKFMNKHFNAANKWTVTNNETGEVSKLKNVEQITFDDYTMFLDGRNNLPFLTEPLTSDTNEDADSYTINLLEGAIDIDKDSVIHAESVMELNAKGGWTLDGNNIIINPNYYDSLSADEIQTLEFIYKVMDEKGDAVDQTLTITIAGANDMPVVTVDNISATITELINPVDRINYSDTIEFSDVDLSDTHIVSSIITWSGALGSLTAGVSSDTTGTGTGGVISWDYSVLASDVEYLAKDETKLESFTITLDDSNGGTIDRLIEITITGTNDVPVIIAHENLEVDEGDFINGQVVATDIDNDDDTSSLTYILVEGDDIPGFTFNSDGTYSLDANVDAYSTLTRGETIEYTFKWQAIDSHGGMSSIDTLLVTITGTNDVPVVEYSDLVGAVTELVIPDASLSDTGTINFSDANLDDIHTISSIITPSGALGTLIADVTSDTTGTGTGGVISWDYSVLASDVEYLAKNQIKVESFILTLDDGAGATVNRTIDVTITGTNDSPVIVTHLDIETAEDSILNGQVVATDIDSDDNTASLKYILIDGSDIPGFIFNEDGSYSLDATVDAYQSLAMNETAEHTFKWQAEDSNGARSSEDEVKIIVTGTNDTPTVTSALTTYTFNLLEGVSDVDNGSQLHIENLIEADAKDGWSVQGNTMSIDSELYKELYLNDMTETFNFSYDIVDEHGASVSQSLNFEVEGKALPSLSLTTEAGSRANIIMLSVTATPFANELLNISFNNLPAGVVIFDDVMNNVTAEISNYVGTQTFQIVLPEDQDAIFDLLVTVTGDNGAQNIQPVELSYDVASASELLSFNSQDQNMWGNFDGTIGWHEYIPFVGEVSQEWNDETKVWDDLGVDPWSSGWFNIVDLKINSSNISEILLFIPKAALDLAKLAQTGAQELLQIAQDWLSDATTQFNHISSVSLAWIDYGLKDAAYFVAKTAYDGAKWLADEAKDNMNADARNLINQENWLDTLQDQRANLESDARVYVSIWVPTPTWSNPFKGHWSTSWFYDPIKLALVALKDLEIVAQKAYILLVEGDAWLTEVAYDGLKAIQDGLYDPMVSAQNSKNAAYTYADNLEDAMHDDGYYTDLSYSDGDGVAIAGEAVLATGEVGLAETSVLGAEGVLFTADLAVIAAQESYDLAESALDLAMDTAALDFSTELKVDANLYAEIGLQIDFELDLGSVDTNIDYMLTSDTHYNQTTDMLSILPTMTNMTTGDSVAYSTISPNVTFFVAVLYDIWADLEIYMDAYLSAWHLEFNEYGELVPVNGMIFDVSPDTDGITINTTVSTDSWSDLLDTLPPSFLVDFLPDLPADIEAGELVLVDFDSTELEPFEVPFIETLTDDMVSIELAFPTIETEGVEEVYTESHFEEGGLISVDFSEISSAIFNLVNAKLEYSEEFLDMYPSVSSLGDSKTIDDLVDSLIDAFLAVLWDNLDAQSTAAPIFVLDATDESSTSLLHVNLFPDEVMTDTLSDNTADFGFYTSYGESDPVLKVTLDIDQVVAVIANKVIKAVIAASTAGVGTALEAIPTINPLDLEFGIKEILEFAEVPEDVAEGITHFVDLSIGIEAADIDAYAAANFSQEFSLSIDDMSYVVTFEDSRTQSFSANTEGELLINDASSYDLNDDGVVEYSLDIVPTAMFSNDTEVGLSMGYSIELLQAELAAGVTLPLGDLLGTPFLNIEIPLVDVAIGPLLTIEGDLDILDVDVFESRFEFDVGSDQTELLTVGVTDDTMFVA